MKRAEATGADKTGKVIFSTPVTHTDWMSRDRERIGHGETSVKYILDRCKEVGWQRIYWRCFDSGQALYDSDLLDSVVVRSDPDNYSAWASPGRDVETYRKGYEGFDSLKAAVDYGHEIGLEVHAWLTINEDDHAWGAVSRFSRRHPQFRWVKRSGMPYNSQLSFAFEEVREYKLALLKEILAYDIDGVFFDWIRTGDVRNDPQATADGTADFGYERPLVEGFEKQCRVHPKDIPNNDERWVRYRAEPQTLFMRGACELIRAKDKSLPISMMGHHAWSYRGVSHANGNLHGLLLDTPTWAREGLIDEIVAAGYYTEGGTPEKAFAQMKDEVGDRCNIWLWWWVSPDAEDFRKSIVVAEELGVGQILYWESDYIDIPERRAQARELTEAMQEYVRA